MITLILFQLINKILLLDFRVKILRYRTRILYHISSTSEGVKFFSTVQITDNYFYVQNLLIFNNILGKKRVHILQPI